MERAGPGGEPPGPKRGRPPAPLTETYSVTTKSPNMPKPASGTA